jgi:hypothetical protein
MNVPQLPEMDLQLGFARKSSGKNQNGVGNGNNRPCELF